MRFGSRWKSFIGGLRLSKVSSYGCLTLMLNWCLSATPVNPVSPYRNLVAGAPQYSQSADFQVGHARVEFSGSWTLLQKDAKAVGIVIEGKGVVHYRTEFELEFPVVTRLLSDWTSVKPLKNGAGLDVEVPFEHARIYFHGLSLPVWPTEGPTQDSKPPTLDAPLLAKVFSFDAEQELALAEALPGKQPWMLMELSRGSKTWIYRYDPEDTHEETLTWVQADQTNVPELADWRRKIRISRQPINWDIRKGPLLPPYQISGLDVDLRTSDNMNANFVVQETILSFRDSLKLLKFNLMDLLISRKNTRILNVRRITDDQGRELAFDHHQDSLVLALASPISRDQSVKLRFEYEGDILEQPRGDNYWQLGVSSSWYPQSDHLQGESYTYHGTVRTKGQWICFQPGETIRRAQEGEWNVLETKSDRPICFATILGGKYFLDEETKNGLTVRVATYAFKGGSGNRPIKEHAFNIIDFYKEILGSFPFKELTVVQVNEWGYGQAPPGMMYITNEAFNQIQDWGPFFRTGLRGRFSHEIAHQYWGTVVKMPSMEEQWITESFAEYCAGLYEAVFKGERAFKDHAAHWADKGSEYAKYGPIPLANDLHTSDWEGFFARTHLLYSKGPTLLRALHKELGDNDFIVFLRSLQRNFRWKFMTTYQVFDLLKFMKKKDYTPFAERFYWGLGVP